ncbi:MAG: DMT family transporter [Porphyromonadaceae bacterium]|nr:MAG: DMT family transporter [Porphyromonadaceae bacterium]
MVKKKKLSRNAIIGYPAGIITGVTYGLNPLFGKPLMDAGASIDTILFYRYFFAVVLLGGFLLLTKQSFRVTAKQAGVLLLLGVLYTMSSTTLFEAYNYIASGLATTLVFLYPVLVAIIMVFLRVVPSWQVWLSIIATFIGVIITDHGRCGAECCRSRGRAALDCFGFGVCAVYRDYQPQQKPLARFPIRCSHSTRCSLVC